MEEAIEDIKRVSKEFCDGETPTWREMEEHGEHHPETYTIRNDCKWNDLVEEAELEINLDKSKEEWTKQEIIDEIKKLSKEHDNSLPKSKEITARYTKYGTWDELLIEAGLDPKKNDTRKKDVIKSCRNFMFEERKIPHLDDIYKDDISQRSVYQFYDSKRELLIDAGLKEVIREEVYRISDDLPPTCREFQNKTNFHLELVKELFGSWIDLLDDCGFDAKKRYKGKNHNNWRGGHDDYYGQSWSEQRKRAIERDGYKCRICSRKDFVQVHHITPKRFWRVDEEHKKMNHERNLISLCPKHHGMLECEFMGRSHDEFVECVREKYGIMLY